MANGEERQSHGFRYEHAVLQRYGISKSKKYTSEYDNVDEAFPLQIKCIQYGGDIELGSYKRNKNKNKDFYLFIGFWKDNKDNIIEEVVYRIDHNHWVSNLQYDKDSQMFMEMELISNLHDDDDRWEQFCCKHKQGWETFGNKLSIRFKRDHKTQKRIQCAIPLRHYETWFKSTFKHVSMAEFEDSLKKMKQTISNNTKKTNMASDNIQKVGLSRNKDGVSRDKYYTKPSLAQTYIDTFFEIVKPCDSDLVVEPSAGDGAFSNILKDTCNLLSYDIEPKQPYITELDFLSIDTDMFDGVKVHCIGNPPFGRSGNLAKQFVKKCCEFAHTVSFILPKSFKKPSCYRTFPMHFHKVYQEDCPKKSFIVNGKEYNAQCVFQIWVRKDIERPKEVVIRPVGYTFVKKHKQPHIALTRVGGGSGKAHVNYKDKSVESNLFVKFNDNIISNIDLEKFVSQFNQLQHEFNNTAGPRSIAKTTEFIPMMNEQLRLYFDNLAT